MKKLLDLLTAAAVSTVMMFAAACNPEKLPDDRFPDDEDSTVVVTPKDTTAFPDGPTTWEDNEENSDGDNASFRIFASGDITLTACGNGAIEKEGEAWTLTGGNEVEVGVMVPGDKFFVDMLVEGYAELLEEYSYDADAKCYTGQIRLRSDVTLTPEYMDVPEPQVGDYYYADGTWSTELNSSKQCIGIVFATGRNEHDSQQYAELTDVRGYVVAVRNSDPEKQRNTFGLSSKVDKSDLDGDLEIFAGYTRTHSMEQQPEYSYENFWACWSATHHIHPAPAMSSGWYLPAFGEFNVLFSVYHNVIREKILSVEGGEDMDGENNLGYYWAMGIKEGTNDFSHVDFRESTQTENETFADRIKTKPLFAYTRPVLTF